MAGDASLATVFKSSFLGKTDIDRLYQLLVHIAHLTGQRGMDFVKHDTKITPVGQSNKI